MRWIKLFESFTHRNKVKFINEKFLYFKVFKDLNEMNLQMIETDSNIYFYNILHNIKILKFVYCKKNRVKAFTRKLVCGYTARENYIKQIFGIEINQLPDFTLYLLAREIYEKAIKDFFSKYIDETFTLRTVDNWKRYKNNFRKTYNT